MNPLVAPNFTLIDTLPALSAVVDSLKGLPTEPPSIYVDLEGVNLSRNGTISILQLYIHPTKKTYLIDVLSLKDRCFSTPGGNGHSLKVILESTTIPKVFFDVRNDSDALYSHFQISLAGILDLQLMELATRTFPRRLVQGLAKCIEKDALFMCTIDRLNWMETKERGANLFLPEKGGSYQVFLERPQRREILTYCAQDVHILPRLWGAYDSKITAIWKQRVVETSMDRVRLSQSPSYNAKERDKILAPAGWARY
ncbi:3 -5 exonuclease [Trichoderma arundinaceum]|uniref:3-5 exonuclease n=1 Tax=Trichoderma arundinaceum TaxID=490622 RepID=A0A395NZE2_TRIAR|nr:3 -5 exonuclease [Trichoderma arundinaceum]